MNLLKLRKMLEQFFLEDIGEKDVTSDSIFPRDTNGEFHFIAKESGIFCGKDVMVVGFEIMNKSIEVKPLKNDGEIVEKGEVIAIITGPMADLLKGERVILNLIQRMSGIATTTRKAVNCLNSQHTKLCDTRKTTPGLRMLEKYAVRVGGGSNHRYGLYDGVMIKDNHIAFAGSIKEAVRLVKEKTGHMVKIEVETETKAQVLEAIEANVDVIMLDNRTPEEIKEWMPMIPAGIITEASGGITLETLSSYGDTGVDYISLGFLTHSVKALDISAKVKGTY